jgi:hypothetical protein
VLVSDVVVFDEAALGLIGTGRRASAVTETVVKVTDAPEADVDADDDQEDEA